MVHQTCYDSDRLIMLLESRLGTEEEAGLCRHLERCNRCRSTLENLAAGAGEWAAMRELLSSSGRDDGDFEWSAPPRQADGGEEVAEPTILLPPEFLAPTDDPAFLGRIGSYEVTGVIGRGGMSIVLKAFDRPLGRNVAIKVLAPQLAVSAAARQRFAREARAAAAVVHEHVIPIHAVAEHGGLPYLVMPYYPAKPLQRRIDESGPLAVAEVLRIARQVSAGLAAAHAQGLVHRDVKPASILLENGVERAVVTDFGLARAIDDASVTSSGTIAGTPQYMAPEQARGEAVDHRADLFSLGSVIYAMCAGRPPFRAETTLGVLRRVCEEEPRPIREVNADVPDWLADAVTKLHAKDPAERFATAREAEAYFESGLAHVQNPAAVPRPPWLGPSRPRRPGIWRLRLRGLRWPLAAAVFGLAAGAAGVAWMGGPEPLLVLDAVNVIQEAGADRESGGTPRVAPGTPASEGGSTPSGDPAAFEIADTDVGPVRARVRDIESAWSTPDAAVVPGEAGSLESASAPPSWQKSRDIGLESQPSFSERSPR